MTDCNVLLTFDNGCFSVVRPPGVEPPALTGTLSSMDSWRGAVALGGSGGLLLEAADR